MLMYFVIRKYDIFFGQQVLASSGEIGPYIYLTFPFPKRSMTHIHISLSFAHRLTIVYFNIIFMMKDINMYDYIISQLAFDFLLILQL